MPVNNNVDALNFYDNAAGLTVPQLSVHDPALEHAAHCLAFETLREIVSRVITVEQYNAMDDATWADVKAESVKRAKRNPSSSRQIQQLSESDIEGACNLGGNYFEHGYTTIIGNTSAPDKRTFERTGTVR